MGKDLEGNVYEEQLRALGLFSPEQMGLRGGLLAAAVSHDTPKCSEYFENDVKEKGFVLFPSAP